MSEVKIRFLREYQVAAAGGERYLAGQTIVCSQSTAEHFMSRGAAEAAPGDVPAKPKAKPGRKPKATA